MRQGAADVIKKVPLVTLKCVDKNKQKKEDKRCLVSNGTRTASSIPMLPLICLHGAGCCHTHGFKTSKGAVVCVFFKFMQPSNANQCRHTLNIPLCWVCIGPELSRPALAEAKTLKCGLKRAAAEHSAAKSHKMAGV